jgi:tRNA/rRNA methyltransferase
MTSPAIILVETQMPENAGSAGRVMANFGLKDLRLVAPKFRWPNPASASLSVGAFDGEAGVQARVTETLAEALADRTYVLAASRGRARPTSPYWARARRLRPAGPSRRRAARRR